QSKEQRVPVPGGERGVAEQVQSIVETGTGGPQLGAAERTDRVERRRDHEQHGEDRKGRDQPHDDVPPPQTGTPEGEARTGRGPMDEAHDGFGGRHWSTSCRALVRLRLTTEISETIRKIITDMAAA